MGKKLRAKDYRTGYEKGFNDALKLALSVVNGEFDRYNKEIANDKESSSC